MTTHSIATAPGMPSRRRLAVPHSLAVLAAALIALVVLAVLIAQFAATPQTYAADTPEGAFQRQFQAYEAGDFELAYGYFSSDVKESMSESQYERWALEAGYGYGGNERVTLDDVVIRDGRATLRLTVSEPGGGVFPTSYEWDADVPLVLEEGTWRIDAPIAGLSRIDPWMFDAPGYPGTWDDPEMFEEPDY
jgi:hypothetical protein